MIVVVTGVKQSQLLAFRLRLEFDNIFKDFFISSTFCENLHSTCANLSGAFR